MSEGCLEGGKVEGRSRRAGINLDLHYSAGVGAISRERRRCAARVAQIGVTGVIVIAWVACREGCRCVVVKNESLAGVLRKVDNDVCSLGRSE